MKEADGMGHARIHTFQPFLRFQPIEMMNMKMRLTQSTLVMNMIQAK
jgi:hypothetical protein